MNEKKSKSSQQGNELETGKKYVGNCKKKRIKQVLRFGLELEESRKIKVGWYQKTYNKKSWKIQQKVEGEKVVWWTINERSEKESKNQEMQTWSKPTNKKGKLEKQQDEKQIPTNE